MCIYFNPGCGTCRTALELMQKEGIEPEVVTYMESPPDAKTIRDILKKLKLPVRELLRTKDKMYLELGLDDPSVSEKTIIDAMTKHPGLIQRPIVIKGNRAILGRPAEKVLEIV